MFEKVKFSGPWQVWNVTCDGSIIVENFHRNMGFFRRQIGREAKASLLNALKTIKPAFSLSEGPARVVLGSDLEQDPDGFHVFDYVQLDEANIDIKAHVQVIDFRLGSFVVFAKRIFTAERIADELDTYPGRPFLIRYLKDGVPVPIKPENIFGIVVPSDKDVRGELQQDAYESLRDEPGECKPHELEAQVDNYIDTYCYPDLDLKLPAYCCSR